MGTRTLAGVVALLALLAARTSVIEGSDDPPAATPLELFQQRIMPIFKSPEPASCVQCHLAAVDLKDYILPSQEQTFASLRDQGLINLAQPGESKILTLIRMGEKDLDQGARMIHAKTRQAEYEAFAAWIEACCNDPKLRNLPKLDADDLARPKRPDEVIRHARKSRVVDSFVRNVWSQRMRCFPCHTPHELDESNPKQRVAIERHKAFLAEYGDEFAERLNIFLETPEATVQSLIEKSRKAPPGTMPIINLHEPTKSLLVLKPTSKLPPRNEQREFEQPSYAEPVSHMGGLKMHVDDQSYKAFVAWIEDYARVVGNQYQSVDDLPADNWRPSKLVIMIRKAPEAWPVGARIQFFVHAWDAPTGAWAKEPTAFTQGLVTPIKNVAGALFLLRPKRRETSTTLDAENAQLEPGRYLLKAYLDSKNRLADDPTLLLGDDDFFGQTEIDARWEEGFPKAEKIAGERFN